MLQIYFTKEFTTKIKKSNTMHRMSLPKWVMSEVGWVNCEENYFPILEQVIPSMIKQI